MRAIARLRWHALRPSFVIRRLATTPRQQQEHPTMNRRELVAALAERLDTDKRSADAALTAVT
ncbi:MAG: hypothetical protein U0W40_17650, partial [Acidimicrobiia bacterium]